MLWLTALALAMDSFTVAITAGLIIKRVQMRHFLIIAFFFGAFQALMPLAGWAGSVYFYRFIEQFDHWIAFGLLGFIGVNMIREALSGDDECDESAADFSVRKMLLLAIATSIDALAVGVSFAFLGVNIWTAVLLIGVITMILSMIGLRIGNIFGCRYKSKAEIAGGCVLILMGCKILFEHIF